MPLGPLRSVMLATTALVPLGIVAAAANPQGPNIVGGAASVSGIGTRTVTINQTTPRAIINWNSFNIGAGETTRFVQPGAGSIALNRVTGGMGPSMLNGTLTANGRVFLLNPDGVMIGGGAVINTAGFLATSNDIANEHFMRNPANRPFQFNIPGRPDASIANLGTINSHSHGFAALVAPGVRNSGTITATYGKISLAAGNSYSLDLYGDQLIKIAVGDSIGATVRDVATGQPLNALVRNEGRLSANGGRVELTAASARTLVDSVINNRGVIEARSVGRREGRIVLGAATTRVAGLPPQTVKVSGTLTTANKTGKGGAIQVTGESIVIEAASFDASGTTGGGRVLIGGDTGGGYGHWAVASIPQAGLEARAVPTATTVSVDAATTIDASATSVGDGGKVIVWADGNTTFAGTIKATGGATSGNGGFVEVSGKHTLAFNGLVNAGAPHGKNGMLLLDPLNARIDTVAGPGIITVSSLLAALQNNDVIVTTGAVGNEPGDLFINAPITWSNANDLLLTAHRNIHVNAAITNTFVAVGGDFAEINLFADSTGTGVGTVFFGANGSASTTGLVNIVFNPSVNPQGSAVNLTSYVNPIEDFSPFVTAGRGMDQLMLVNTPNDLQNIKNNLSSATGNYVLGRNIDMGSAGIIDPIGNGLAFNGQFEGLGRTISNVTINSGLGNVGLFSEISNTAEIAHLNLKDFSVTASALLGANVGVLAGSNAGNVHDINVIMSDVTVNSGSSTIGGLIGYNTGNISRSHTSGTANIGSGILTSVRAGGLVGWNDGGLIQESFALGSITTSSPGAFIELGGLVGRNEGNIEDAYSRGSISGLASNVIGGLVGYNEDGSTITRAYSAGTATGGGAGSIGRFVGFNNNTSGGISQSYFLTGPGSGIGGGTTSGPGVDLSPKTDSELKEDPLGTLFAVPAAWTRTPGHNASYPHFSYELKPFNTATVLTPQSGETTPPIPNEVLAPPTFQYLPDRQPQPPDTLIQLTNLNPTTSGGSQRPATAPPGTPPRSLAPPRPLRAVPGPDGEIRSNVPLPGVTQFLSTEIVVQALLNTPPATIQQFAQQLGLTIITSQTMPGIGRQVFRFRLGSGQTVRNIIRALEANSAIVAQPNYTYQLVQAPAAIAPFTASRGDPAQYSMGKLHLNEAHRVSSGKGITVAVIDSEVDNDHAELAGTISQRFDATDSEARAHSHGTAMAGAIVSRDRLLGVAPGARILAVRAFSETQSSAESTTVTILRSIEWAVSQGARVINMSFAGPYDPSLERVLKDAAAKGVILIGASGNAGPKSPPLWPGADPHVIAVTATDSGDKLFRQANRGPYVSVASPGVEILAPAPQAGYQMSTGTSIATAHVSGVVALMLERDPTLTPLDVRLILESTASDLGPKGRDTQFGWGLVNPARALAMVDERKRQRGSASTPARR